MSYLKQHKATGNADLIGRITACVVELAKDVLNESSDVPSHEDRVAMAREFVRSPYGYINDFIWDIVMNPTISTKLDDDGGADSVLDDEIKYVINTSFNNRFS